MAGRKPKTDIDLSKTHISKADKDRRVANTPICMKQDFIPPESLNDQELEVWNRLKEIYHDTYNCTVSDADRDLMELYCRAKVAADNADQAIKQDPRYYIIVATGKDKEGEIKTTVKANPQYKIRHDNMLLCLKYFDQLGLSPVARARAGVGAANAKKDEDIWKDIFNRSDDQ